MGKKKSVPKSNVLNETIQGMNAISMYIQPFKEMPSLGNSGDSNDRMNAHDLFSQYTADVIKEDIIYAR